MIKFISTEQFKTIQFHFQFLEPIEKDAFVYRFLLTRILRSYTDSHPTIKEFNQRLSYLYGMQISDALFTLEDQHIIKLTISIPDYHFIDDQMLLTQTVALIEEVIFKRNPFDQQIFNEVKRVTSEHVATIKERRFEYAKTQFYKQLYQGNDLAHPLSGTLDEILEISSQSLYDYYQRYFLKNPFVLIVNGNLSAEDQNLITQTFNKYVTNKEVKVNRFKGIDLEYHHYQETIDISAAYLFAGYSLPISIQDPLYYAAVLTNLIIGNYPDSSLFRIFREELLLAYDVESDYSYDKGQLLIYANVDSSDCQASFESLISLMSQIISDGVSAEELESAKIYLVNMLKMGTDLQERQAAELFIQVVYQREFSLNDAIKQIMNTTLDDIYDCLSLLELKASYILSGGSDET